MAALVALLAGCGYPPKSPTHDNEFFRQLSEGLKQQEKAP